MKLIYFTTPDGALAIVKRRIAGISQCNINVGATTILTRIYIHGDKEPFNLLDDFTEVCNKVDDA